MSFGLSILLPLFLGLNAKVSAAGEGPALSERGTRLTKLYSETCDFLFANLAHSEKLDSVEAIKVSLDQELIAIEADAAFVKDSSEPMKRFEHLEKQLERLKANLTLENTQRAKGDKLTPAQLSDLSLLAERLATELNVARRLRSTLDSEQDPDLFGPEIQVWGGHGDKNSEEVSAREAKNSRALAAFAANPLAGKFSLKVTVPRGTRVSPNYKRLYFYTVANEGQTPQRFVRIDLRMGNSRGWNPNIESTPFKKYLTTIEKVDLNGRAFVTGAPVGTVTWQNLPGKDDQSKLKFLLSALE